MLIYTIVYIIYITHQVDTLPLRRCEHLGGATLDEGGGTGVGGGVADGEEDILEEGFLGEDPPEDAAGTSATDLVLLVCRV